MLIEHNNHVVDFDEKNHLYIMDRDKKLTSVTKFISSFFPEFNAKKVAEKCVGKKEYKGMSVEEIMKQWDDNKTKASDEGKRVHTFTEGYLDGKRHITVNKIDKEAMKAVDKLLEEHDFFESEKIVFSPTYLLSGTIDCIMKNKKTGDIVLVDWKTNKEIKKFNKFEKGFNPLQDAHNCNFVHYSLQLNLYKLLLHNEGYMDCTNSKMMLCHITEKGHEIHEIENMENNVFLMLFSRGLL